MPKTLTIPERHFVETYNKALDIQELTKLLLHHTFLETHQGDGHVLPGQLSLLEVLTDRLDGLVNNLDHSTFRSKEVSDV
ncbi:hypothetical protein [Maridesulfovibrio sp.]|uniref:hypothetical protein n=1 Tax=Maridesulfovibrio sp. TaxID=2795000 RepID=UPI0029F55ADD|nr:hypothetical protein [Maridesulfovibrio sp.]